MGRVEQRCVRALVVAVMVVAAAGCSSSSDTTAGGSTTTTRRVITSTTEPAERVWSAEVTGEADVDGNFRQGIARSGDDWLFTSAQSIFRTNGGFVKQDTLDQAIPAKLADQGYDHLGDPDVADGKVWVPIERDDKSKAEQVTARYDERSLTYLDSFVVPQHHNAFVAVDDRGVAYSADEFGDDTIVRYTVSNGEVKPRTPLKMSRTVERIQGGDVADGALWLSTDDDHNGVYRVDLKTGEVSDLGSMGHVDGEGEGIDATRLRSGLLHPLVADAAIVPMWVVHLKVHASPAG